MTGSAVRALTVAAALGSGLAAGVCFAHPRAVATAAGCAVAAVAAVLDRHEPYAGWLLAGSALYLLGAIGLTAAYHVPKETR